MHEYTDKDLRELLNTVDQIAARLNSLDPVLFLSAMCLLFDEYAVMHPEFDPVQAAEDCARHVRAVNEAMDRMEEFTQAVG